jgi:hypothetical protein
MEVWKDLIGNVVPTSFVTIRVKKGQNLYLTRETLEAMRKRDLATGKRYRDLRNEVSRLVRRDKQDSNLLSLKKACNDPKVGSSEGTNHRPHGL